MDDSSKSRESWRVFIAIDLPSLLRQRIAHHINRLRDSNPDARASWGREENLHLTLKFRGEIPVTTAEALSNAAQAAARAIDQFDLVVGGCGAFPAQAAPRVLWLGIEDPSGKLAALHRAIEDECERAGFAREPRDFHPHLTIARLRKPQGSRQLAAVHEELGFSPEAVSVSQIVVIRSELSSEGSRYTVLARHPLQLK